LEWGFEVFDKIFTSNLACYGLQGFSKDRGTPKGANLSIENKRLAILTGRSRKNLFGSFVRKSYFETSFPLPILLEAFDGLF
jgi:hypothetical protein